MRFILILMFLSFHFSDAEAFDTFRIHYNKDLVSREYPENSHPTIGLALSGGGACGIAHIGVIDVLEKNGITPYCIAGTSMGSIVGGLYAAGYNPRALDAMFKLIDWNTAFSDTPNRRSIYVFEKETDRWPILDMRFRGLKIKLPYSLSYGQKVISQLSWIALEPTFFCEGDFDKLVIPFRSVATDFVEGNEVVIGKGNLARAMQSSSTVPLVFYPVEFDGKLLVDGGLKNNLPVDVALKMGCDFVIADAIDESMYSESELESFFNVADQATSILMRNLTVLSRDRADFLINPDMKGFSSTKFSNIEIMIEKGRQAAEAAMPELLKKIDDKKTRYKKAVIDSITVYPAEYFDMAEKISLKYINYSEETYYPRIISALEEIWRTGSFLDVTASYDEKTGILSYNLIKTPSVIRLIVNGDSSEVTLGERMDVVSATETPNIHVLVASLDSLIHNIRLQGMSFASIQDTRLSDSGDSMIFYIRTPKITNITFTDSLKTRHSVITREFLIKKGDVFSMNNLMRTIDNLYGTGLFELVYPDVSPYKGGVAVHLNIKEKDWSALRVGLRYDETESPESRVSLSSENLLGLGGKFRATGHIGGRKKLIMLQNRNDRIWKTFYSFDFRTYNVTVKRPVYLSHSDFIEYDDVRYGTVMSLGQQMDKLGSAVLMFKTETMRAKYSPSSGRKKEKKELRSISMQSVIDTYDRYPFPRNGKLNMISIESANEFFGGSEKYVKIFWSGNAVKTMAKRHTLGGGFSLGAADKSTPYTESFTLGGTPTRLNCYDYDGSMSHFYADFMGLAREERIGNYIAVGKLTYNLFVPKYFHLGLIYSAGNVWDNGEQITFKTALQSYGVQGSFETYLGPMSFGWGITSQGKDMYYMSAGWEF